jgi:CBS domain-containing protein
VQNQEVSAQPLPIRARRTLLADGTTRADRLVFCDRQEGSVELSRCLSCPYGGPLEQSSVGCSRSTLRSTPPPPLAWEEPSRVHVGVVSQMASALPVGLVLVHPVACVAYDVPLRAVAPLLAAEPSPFGIPVVDDAERLVGMLPRASAALAALRGDDSAVATALVSPTCVYERSAIGDAFRLMGARHARELIAVDEDRRVVGTLRDVDALRFVSYVSRTGLRPVPENAA